MRVLFITFSHSKDTGSKMRWWWW